MNDSIRIRGARVHNLKDVSLEIPHDRLTVITGVSGSGKSSLAFDTIYAEGQRRYVESLSAYARQFLERMEKPAVDEIDGIAPPVAIRQKNTTRNPRSTVATSTELYDFLRLLWARAGRTFCPNDGIQVERDTVDRVAEKVLAQPEGSRWYALFPVPAEKSTDALRDRLFDLRKKGFNRLFQGGRVFEFSTPESLLDIDFSKPLFALVDRLAISRDARQRLVDTVEICYREAGEVIFEPAGGGDSLRFNEKFQCKRCGKDFVEPEPTLFSFNSPYGACKRCQGFGNTIDCGRDLALLGESGLDPAVQAGTRAADVMLLLTAEAHHDRGVGFLREQRRDDQRDAAGDPRPRRTPASRPETSGLAGSSSFPCFSGCSSCARASGGRTACAP